MDKETKQILIRLVEESLSDVYRCDYDLIENRNNTSKSKSNSITGGERAIMFRFAHYLLNRLVNYKEFRELDLDCEYYRDGKNKKILELYDEDKDVRPDVILHQRKSNKLNILVIEIKGYWNNQDKYDYRKLEEFTKNPNYQFDLGIFIKIGEKLKKSRMVIFENGAITNEYILCDDKRE